MMSEVWELAARDATKGQSAYRIALFDTFYIVGGLLVLANLLTAWLSPHINRASTWTMFHFSWFLTAVVNLLLLGQQTGPEPNKALCLVQSMFIYAAPVLSSLSGVSFMLHMFLSVLYTIKGQAALPANRVRILEIFPIVGFVFILMEVVVLGTLQPSAITRDSSGMYCHLITRTANKVSAGITFMSMVILISLEVAIFFVLHRAWRKTGQLSQFRNHEFVSIPLMIRVAIFSVCLFFSLIVAVLSYIPGTTNVDTNIVLAFLPVAAGLIFGSQRDILSVWLCRKPRTPTVIGESSA